MHDMNLLPETETIRRQSRLLLLTTIGLTITSGFWIVTTTLTQNDLKTQLQASIDLTESRIQPIPPLNNRINALRAQLDQRDPINLYIDTLPDRTNHLQTPLEQALAAFSSDAQPDITIERLHLPPHDTNPTLTLSGRATSLESIAARFARLNALNIPIANPNSRDETDSTTSFTLEIPLLRTPNDPTSHLTPAQLSDLLDLTTPATDRDTEDLDAQLALGVDDLSDIDLTGPVGPLDGIDDAVNEAFSARELERTILEELEGGAR